MSKSTMTKLRNRRLEVALNSDSSRASDASERDAEYAYQKITALRRSEAQKKRSGSSSTGNNDENAPPPPVPQMDSFIDSDDMGFSESMSDIRNRYKNPRKTGAKGRISRRTGAPPRPDANVSSDGEKEGDDENRPSSKDNDDHVFKVPAPPSTSAKQKNSLESTTIQSAGGPREILPSLDVSTLTTSSSASRRGSSSSRSNRTTPAGHHHSSPSNSNEWETITDDSPHSNPGSDKKTRGNGGKDTCRDVPERSASSSRRDRTRPVSASEEEAEIQTGADTRSRTLQSSIPDPKSTRPGPAPAPAPKSVAPRERGDQSPRISDKDAHSRVVEKGGRRGRDPSDNEEDFDNEEETEAPPQKVTTKASDKSKVGRHGTDRPGASSSSAQDSEDGRDVSAENRSGKGGRRGIYRSGAARTSAQEHEEEKEASVEKVPPVAGKSSGYRRGREAEVPDEDDHDEKESLDGGGYDDGSEEPSVKESSTSSVGVKKKKKRKKNNWFKDKKKVQKPHDDSSRSEQEETRRPKPGRKRKEQGGEAGPSGSSNRPRDEKNDEESGEAEENGSPDRQQAQDKKTKEAEEKEISKRQPTRAKKNVKKRMEVEEDELLEQPDAGENEEVFIPDDVGNDQDPEEPLDEASHEPVETRPAPSKPKGMKKDKPAPRFVKEKRAEIARRKALKSVEGSRGASLESTPPSSPNKSGHRKRRSDEEEETEDSSPNKRSKKAMQKPTAASSKTQDKSGQGKRRSDDDEEEAEIVAPNKKQKKGAGKPTSAASSASVPLSPKAATPVRHQSPVVNGSASKVSRIPVLSSRRPVTASGSKTTQKQPARDVRPPPSPVHEEEPVHEEQPVPEEGPEADAVPPPQSPVTTATSSGRKRVSFSDRVDFAPSIHSISGASSQGSQDVRHSSNSFDSPRRAFDRNRKRNEGGDGSSQRQRSSEGSSTGFSGFLEDEDEDEEDWVYYRGRKQSEDKTFRLSEATSCASSDATGSLTVEPTMRSESEEEEEKNDLIDLDVTRRIEKIKQTVPEELLGTKIFLPDTEHPELRRSRRVRVQAWNPVCPAPILGYRFQTDHGLIVGATKIKEEELEAENKYWAAFAAPYHIGKKKEKKVAATKTKRGRPKKRQEERADEDTLLSAGSGSERDDGEARVRRSVKMNVPDPLWPTAECGEDPTDDRVWVNAAGQSFVLMGDVNHSKQRLKDDADTVCICPTLYKKDDEGKMAYAHGVIYVKPRVKSEPFVPMLNEVFLLTKSYGEMKVYLLPSDNEEPFFERVMGIGDAVLVPPETRYILENIGDSVGVVNFSNTPFLSKKKTTRATNP